MSNKSKKSPDIVAKLKACDFEVQEYVRALESKLLELTKKNAYLEADNVFLNDRVKFLTKENLKPQIVINKTYYNNPNKNDKKNQ